MEKKFTRTNTTVSMLNYHFVFCPYRRRKIFNIPGVEARFKELVMKELSSLGVEVLAFECHVDHAYLFVRALPTQSPAFLMRRVKGCTSKRLRSEIPALRKSNTLWTRSYFVSTAGDVSSETIMNYVNTQKTRS